MVLDEDIVSAVITDERRATGPRRDVPVQTRRQWRRVEDPRVLASDAVTRRLV